MKSKLKGAQNGHNLLKRKSEALTRRFREITKKIEEVILIFEIFKIQFKNNKYINILKPIKFEMEINI